VFDECVVEVCPALSADASVGAALAEMRRLLGLLRKDDDPRALAPQPGLEQLPELASTLGDAGLACELQIEGEPIPLTPGIDLVGYRVIETALETAAAVRCRQANATVRYEPRQLELEIRGDVPLPSATDSMRAVTARVDLYGGKIDVLPAERDEFAVRCRLPLEGTLSA